MYLYVFYVLVYVLMYVCIMHLCIFCVILSVKCSILWNLVSCSS